ncbi:MAG TPA: 3-hydroxyacyl-ACP dehydratase FabZ family protein [Verrucomicrobiae bacterium]|nr:3-hydroxyacyl-ACP dehydratase FabZ family protein [Verrucomicrobiae bacterium]
MSLTPHGPGFSFIDAFEVLDAGKRGRGRKWLDPAAPFFADHFPGNPLMPGVLLIECAAQAAGVLWQQPGAAFLAAVTQFRFIKPVLPDQTLEIEVMLAKDFGALSQFETVLRVGGEIVAQGRLTLSRARSSSA